MSLKAISVKINNGNQRPSSISYDNNIVVKVNGQQEHNVNYFPGKATKFISELYDVDATNPLQDEVLIYNDATKKYESRPLEVGDLNLNNIDAGTF